MLGITEVIENLYISGLETRQAILNKGIRCVLNVSSECPVQDLGANVDYEKISLLDLPSTSIQPYFDRLTDRIHQNLQNGKKTLVHCYVGRSRSASIILAYLMKYKQMPLRDAFHYLRSRRHIVGPNFGFIKQLINYERSLFGYASVSFVNTTFGSVPDIYLSMSSNRSRRQPITPTASLMNNSSTLTTTNGTLNKRISSSQPQRSTTTMSMPNNGSPSRSSFLYSTTPQRPVNQTFTRSTASALPTRATTTISSYSPLSNAPTTNSKLTRPGSSSFTYQPATMSNGSPSKSILRQPSDVTRLNSSTMTTNIRSGDSYLPNKVNSLRTVKYVPSSYNRYHLT